MKIIKKGEIPEDKIIHKTCYNCKTEMEFQKKEEKSDSNGTYVNCPLCKSRVIIHSYSNYMDR